MRRNLLIIGLLLTQAVAKAQYDSTSLQATADWIVHTLTHQQEIKLKNGHAHTDVQIRASFDNRTKKLIIEERFYSDSEHYSYTTTTLPLLLLNEKYEDTIAVQVSPKTTSHIANGQESIAIKTRKSKPVIRQTWTCAEYGSEEIRQLASFSIILYNEQLEKDKYLAHKLSKALKNAITLAKQDNGH